MKRVLRLFFGIALLTSTGCAVFYPPYSYYGAPGVYGGAYYGRGWQGYGRRIYGGPYYGYGMGHFSYGAGWGHPGRWGGSFGFGRRW